MITRAAAYARYSTSRQHETSIEAQLQAIDAFCKQQGWQLSHLPYLDEALSGTNTNRASFHRLLDDARLGRFDVIVVYDLSRGARDVADWFNFRKEMEVNGIRVVSATGGIGNLNDPNDFLQESIQATVGQFMVMQSRQKSIAGKRVRASRGLFMGGTPPLGYDIDKEKGAYVINHREAKAVRLIFDMYAAGHSYADIIREVDKIGVTGKFGQPIQRNTLHYILKNPRYTGTFIWGEYEMRNMHQWVGRRNPEEEVIRIEEAIPQIIPPHIFDIVARRMRENRHANSVRTPDRCYLLSGIIRCGLCGAPMSGVTVTSRGYSYKKYFCSNRRKQQRCAQKELRAEKLEAFVLDLLRDRVLTEDYLNALVDRIVSIADHSKRRAAISAEIQSLDNKIANILTAIETGQPPEALLDRLNRHTRQKEQLVQQLSSIPRTANINRAAVRQALVQDIQCAMDKPKEQKAIIQQFFSDITVDDSAITLTLSPNLTAFTTPQNQKKATTSKVVTFAGSPGRTRTYNNSVNSRVLCH